MSGFLAPQIMALTYEVDTNFERYVNLSFPFRVKIGRVWFTADERLSGSFNDNWEREVRLGGIKTRNAKTTGDAPSDFAPFFGGGDGRYDWDDNLKPYIWLGYPDARPAGQVVQADPGWGSNDYNFRSSAGVAAPAPAVNALTPVSSRDYAYVNPQDAINDGLNPYWDNWGWGSTEEWTEKRYKTDQSILNPDEFLSLFVFDAGGDWSDYETTNNENYNVGLAPVTIFVEYSAVAGPDDSSPTRIWD